MGIKRSNVHLGILQTPCLVLVCSHNPCTMKDTQSLKQYTDAKKNVCNMIGQNIRGNSDATSFQTVEATMDLAKTQQKMQITRCNERSQYTYVEELFCTIRNTKDI